ncbi:hypothetical protein [Oxobacter pfennigii]|uniref:hypothetical protein n=1 Tax=Oxobacter pfennigii TaxID=36849 RepID=UPI001364A7B6|nr:hypothetical protein [Oxobacter pfennigii]
MALDNFSLTHLDKFVNDALCLAIAERQGLEYGFVTIADDPFKDSTGLNMHIVAFNK